MLVVTLAIAGGDIGTGDVGLFVSREGFCMCKEDAVDLLNCFISAYKSDYRGFNSYNRAWLLGQISFAFQIGLISQSERDAIVGDINSFEKEFSADGSDS